MPLKLLCDELFFPKQETNKATDNIVVELGVIVVVTMFSQTPKSVLRPPVSVLASIFRALWTV